jgi:hypothetical protein
MERSSSSSVTIAAIGSVLVCAATLFQYIESHRLGQLGGYFPLVIGAASIWILVASCGYFARSVNVRSKLTAALQGLLAALAFVAINVATLIWAFGS